MNDNDSTIDADDSMLDELRRLAADAKASLGSPELDTDVTVDADDRMMEELRRFAEEARSEVGVATEWPEVAPVVEDEQGAVHEAPDPFAQRPSSQDSVTVPLVDIPDIQLPPGPSTQSKSSVPVPEFEPVKTPPPSRPSSEDSDVTQLRGGRMESLSAPPPVDQGDGWRPPPRMVMPNDPEKQQPNGPGQWKFVAVGLGAAVLVLIVVLALGLIGGTDAPGDDEVPSSDPTVVSDDPLEPEGEGG